MRLSAALRSNAGVVGALVRIGDARTRLVNPPHHRRMSAGELIGQRENQHHYHLLILRIDLEDVAADAFRCPRLIEEAVSLRLLDCSWNRFPGNRLQLELLYLRHRALSPAF